MDDAPLKRDEARIASETNSFLENLVSGFKDLSDYQQEMVSKYASSLDAPTKHGDQMRATLQQHMANMEQAEKDLSLQFNKSIWSSPKIGEAMATNLSGEKAKDAASVFETAGLTDAEKKLMSFSERISYVKQLFAEFKANVAPVFSTISSGFSKAASAAAAFAKITPFAKLGQQLKDLKKPLDTFFRAFKRVVLYKTIRGGIGQIIQGWKDGFNNLYAYSQKFGTQFHNTMDSLATDMQFLHNGMAAMVAPLVNAIAPAIEAITARVVDLANAIGYFFAKILGQSAFSAAIRGSKAFQDLGGSAKEAKKQLMGFDELNVLTEPSGGGTAGEDYGKMFEEWSTELEEGSIEQQIRNAIENQDWEGLGSLMAEKMNGLTEQFKESGFGTKLGQKIEKGLDIAHGFLTTYDFRNAGAAIAANLNQAIAKIDWYKLGDTLAAGVTGMFDFIIGFIETFDAAAAARAIGNVVKGWFDHFTEWINEVNWEEIGSTFFQKVYDFVTNIDFAGIASSFATFLGSAIVSAFGIIEGFLGSMWDKWNEYCGIEADDSGLEVVLKWLNGIWKGFIGIGLWIYDNIVTPFFNALRGKGGFGLDEEGGAMETAGEDVIHNFLQGMKNFWSNLAKWVDEKVQWIKDKFNSAWEKFTNGQVERATLRIEQEGSIPPQVYMRAAGGTVPTGELFIAGEAGPELVGSVNGKTTVTNQEQFTAGMANIMDVTNTIILQAAQSLVQTIQSKDMTAVAVIGDRDVVRSYDRGKTLAGTSLIE